MGSLSRPLRIVAYYFCGAVFVAGSLCLNLLALLLLLFPKRQSLKGPARRTLRWIFSKYLWLMQTTGVSRFDFEAVSVGNETSRVWVMNHPTIIDAVYLLTLVPNGVCIYKRAIASNPIYGFIARLVDFLPSEGGPDLIRLAVERLEKGEDVIIFPEGTRSAEMNASQLKGGFALIAQRANVPIEALWIDNPPDFLSCRKSIWIVPRLPAQVAIRRIGVAYPQGRESANRLCQRVASVYESRLRNEPVSP